MGNVTQIPACCRSPWRWIALAGVLVAGGALTWLSRPPADPPDTQHSGAELLAQGRTIEAIGAFERALAARDDVGTRVQLAGALKAVGRRDDASREYKRALSLDPKNAVAWFNYGNLLRVEFKDVRGALEAYRKASECDPNLGEAQFSLGAMLMETGDWEAAAAALQSALQVAKPDASWRSDARSALDLARIRDLEKRGLLGPPSRDR